MIPDENGWHPAEGWLADYAHGRSAFAQAASVETHITACAHCRSRLTEVQPDLPIEQMWQHILAVTGPAPPTRRHQATGRTEAGPWTTFFTAPISGRRRIAFAVLTLVLCLTLAMHPAFPRDNSKGVSALTSEAGSAHATAAPVLPRTLQSDDGPIRPPRKGAVNPNIPDVPRPASHAPAAQRSSSPETEITQREPRERLAWRSGSHPD